MSSPQRKATQVAKTSSPRRFVFLLLDRFTMLSFAGAIEPLRIANRVAGEDLCQGVLAGAGEVVACANRAAVALLGKVAACAFRIVPPDDPSSAPQATPPNSPRITPKARRLVGL